MLVNRSASFSVSANHKTWWSSAAVNSNPETSGRFIAADSVPMAWLEAFRVRFLHHTDWFSPLWIVD